MDMMNHFLGDIVASELGKSTILLQLTEPVCSPSAITLVEVNQAIISLVVLER